MWLTWRRAATPLNCPTAHSVAYRNMVVHNNIIVFSHLNITPPPPPVYTPSLFLPSRPLPTPACYLHPPLPRAALTHRRTPPLICRLHPRLTPTLVSVSEVVVASFMSVSFCILPSSWLNHKLTNCFSFFFSLSHSGLISPGISVPVQVPGTEQQSMSQNLGQYWARLQWATDIAKEEGKKGHVQKKRKKTIWGFKGAQVWVEGGSRWVADPKNAFNVYKFSQEQLWLHLTGLWSYWYLLSIIRLHIVFD